MASARLTRTLGTPTNRKKLTASIWLKKSFSGAEKHFFGLGASGGYLDFRFASSDELELYHYNGGYQFRLTTTRKFRDTSGWYHLVFAIDTTLATADDRFKVYVNGVQETVFTNRTNPSQDYDLGSNVSGNTISVGNYGTNTGNSFDGQLAHVHFVDGTAYTPTTFGETDSTTGEWKPKTSPSVTYGTNGFFLKFDNSGNMGLDSSGNSNNLTTSGTVLQYKDTPSNVMPQLNHNDKFAAAITNAGQTVTNENNNGTGVMSTMAVATGKWYWEAKVKSTASSTFNVGIRKTGLDNYGGAGWPYSTDGWVYAVDGNIYNGGSAILNTGTTATVGDIIGFILDLDAGTLKLQKNGANIYSGNAVVSSLNTGDFYHIVQGASQASVDFNFGNGYFGTTAITSAGSNGNGLLFEYDVPSGHYGISTKNIASNS